MAIRVICVCRRVAGQRDFFGGWRRGWRTSNPLALRPDAFQAVRLALDSREVGQALRLKPASDHRFVKSAAVTCARPVRFGGNQFARDD